MHVKVRSKTIAGLVVLLAAVLAACGPSPAVSLTLGSSSATVLRGQSVTVDVTLARSEGASAAVLLSADVPASSGVTATFAPSTLTGSIVTSTMTLDVGTAAADGPITIRVSAEGSGVAARQTFTLTVDSLTVHGSLVARFGAPMPGVNVSSQGVDAVTATDGSFALAGLSAPYDVTLYSTADQWVHVFKGMTAPNPVLMPLVAAAGTPSLARTTALSGTLTGTTVPVAADHVLMVCIEGVSFPVYGGCKALATGDSTYSFSVKWNGAASVPVRVHALEFAVDADEQPTAYGGYGMAETTLTDGGTLTKDVTLGAGPASATFSGAVTAAPGVTPVEGFVALRFSPNLDMFIATFDPTVPFSLPMPSLTNTTFDAVAGGSTAASGQSIAWKVGSTGSAGILMLAAPPVLVTPPAGSTDVNQATQFKATTDAGGLLTFVWNPSGLGPKFAVTTASDMATIPDVAGVALPASTDYNVSLIGSPGFATVDAGARAYIEDYFNLMFILSAGGPGPSTNGNLTVLGSDLSFKTAP